MIDRYDVSIISEIWSLKNKYQTFLTVEKALLFSLEEYAKIPKGVLNSLRGAKINLSRIQALEEEVKHDVIAFCSSISEQMPERYRAYFHFGVTSSDIIDTALSLQIKKSLKLIDTVIEKVIQELDSQVQQSKSLLGLGRSHGVYAEPMLYAQKWLGHLAEFLRRKKKLIKLSSQLTAQFSGAVGNYTVLTPEVEALTAHRLGLDVEPCSTQVIPRDRLAALVNEFALLSCAIERLAIELRHLHHSDINEVCEGFGKSQKGSSTMPHKKNPISAENLSGLSRVVRSYTQIAYDNCLLWHERDISHSSAERLYLPDMFGISYYMLERLARTLNELEYVPQNITEKLTANPQVFSSFILHQLIKETSLSRENLYVVVQEAFLNHKKWDDQLKFIEEQVGVSLNSINEKNLHQHYQDQFSKVYQRVWGIR